MNQWTVYDMYWSSLVLVVVGILVELVPTEEEIPYLLSVCAPPDPVA